MASLVDTAPASLLPSAAIQPSLTPALETLASRFRPAGLCLMLFRANGSIAYHDTAAGNFFDRYVVPLAQCEPFRQALHAQLQALTFASPVIVMNGLPGVAMAAFPHVERRQLHGVLVLAGKSTSFKLGEDTVRACGQLALDGIWLNQHAEELPAYSDEAIQRQARLLLTSLRDQVRLSNLERELTSLSGQLANTYEELSLIYQISGGMRINRRPVDFFRQTCLDSVEVMNIRGMGVALRTEALSGNDHFLYGPLTLPAAELERLSTEALDWLRDRRTSLLINDLARDRQFFWLSEHATRLLAVPLQRGEEILGCLFAVDKIGGDFDSVDSKLLNSIANESAIYLENAVLFEDVHGLMMGLLHSLTSAVDAKDPYTCGHSERVALLSKLLAKEAGMPDAQVERLYMAGLLHDVGKIGVPEAVLQKPGKLTTEEFEAMKKHPAIGARILQDVKQVRDIIPGVLHHHERYDGRGYPDGLAGTNIPLMGRIICLADCFDAMTSTRTYRKALPLEVTLAEMRRCSGTHFDPRLTEAFLRIGVDQFRDILRTQENATRLDLSGAAKSTITTRTLTPGKAA